MLVNLGGYAGTARSADIFALRPAAVAVSYMGFPGTMGSVEMVDYILADGVVVPHDLRHFYSEKVSYLLSSCANPKSFKTCPLFPSTRHELVA